MSNVYTLLGMLFSVEANRYLCRKVGNRIRARSLAVRIITDSSTSVPIVPKWQQMVFLSSFYDCRWRSLCAKP
ncbi:hypothetical protein HD806DRAFT_482890 [Xylariaceae sp. AK1471]|nr:hypothetical protein HD806DRAFT_482890 [Xylariaceae sp. AK1471]